MTTPEFSAPTMTPIDPAQLMKTHSQFLDLISKQQIMVNKEMKAAQEAADLEGGAEKIMMAATATPLPSLDTSKIYLHQDTGETVSQHYQKIYGKPAPNQGALLEHLNTEKFKAVDKPAPASTTGTAATPRRDLSATGANGERMSQDQAAKLQQMLKNRGK